MRNLAALAAVLPLLAPPAAMAQGSPEKTLGGWRIGCEGDGPARQCGVVRTEPLPGITNASVTVVFIRRAGTAAPTPTLIRIVAPTGVLLLPGLTLSVDDVATAAAAFVRCNPNGCIAEVEASDELMARIGNGAVGGVTLWAAFDRAISVRFPLIGVAELMPDVPVTWTSPPPAGETQGATAPAPSVRQSAAGAAEPQPAGAR